MKAEQDKQDHTHYQDLTGNYIVIPVATETLGSRGQAGLKLIKDIGQRITLNNGEKRSTSFIFQAMSMAIQRGNISSIRGSVPNSKTLNELYYL